MNTHKEPKFKVGDRVVYGDTEWDILSISKAGTVSLVHSITRNRTVVSEDSLTLKEYEFDCPHYHRIKGLPWCNYCNFVESTKSRLEEEVEPTPPSQIEEESQTQRSLREMYELGKEHGRTLALKDTEIDRLLKEIGEN